MDVFALITEERTRLAAELERLSPEEWAAPSLCAGWSVQVVAAHLNAPWAVSTPTVLVSVIRSFGSIDRAWDRFSRELADRMSPEACVAGLRANAEHRFTPPTLGPEAPLTDVLVHGVDALRPLGRAVEPSVEARATVVRWLAEGRTQGFLPRGRLADLTLAPSDIEGRWGRGSADITGPALSIAAAALGRAEALDDLAGDGVERLAARL